MSEVSVDRMVARETLIDELQQNPTKIAIAANLTLVPASTSFQIIDPAGTTRNVVLPAEASSFGKWFFIKNLGTATGTLVVQNPALATVITVAIGGLGFTFCDGITWRGNTIA